MRPTHDDIKKLLDKMKFEPGEEAIKAFWLGEFVRVAEGIPELETHIMNYGAATPGTLPEMLGPAPALHQLSGNVLSTDILKEDIQ